jgi:hypothetical protein
MGARPSREAVVGGHLRPRHVGRRGYLMARPSSAVATRLFSRFSVFSAASLELDYMYSCTGLYLRLYPPIPVCLVVSPKPNGSIHHGQRGPPTHGLATGLLWGRRHAGRSAGCHTQRATRSC